MIYRRPSPQDYEYESDYIEDLERWLDYQEYLENYDYDYEYENVDKDS